MLSRSLQAFSILALLALAACSEDVRSLPYRTIDPDRAETLGLCDFGRDRHPDVLVYHHTASGLFIYGDLEDFDAYRANDWQAIRSAYAVPEQAIYKQKLRGDCYSEKSKTYYPCYQTFTLDLSEVGGLARSNHTDVTSLALRVCERAARTKWESNAGFRQTNYSQECRIVTTVNCPFPGAEQAGR